MNKTELIAAAKEAGIPVYEQSDLSGGVKFGACGFYHLLRFANIVARSVDPSESDDDIHPRFTQQEIETFWQTIKEAGEVYLAIKEHDENI